MSVPQRRATSSSHGTQCVLHPLGLVAAGDPEPHGGREHAARRAEERDLLRGRQRQAERAKRRARQRRHVRAGRPGQRSERGHRLRRPDARRRGHERPALNAAGAVGDRVDQKDVGQLVEGTRSLRVPIRAVQQRQRGVARLQDRRAQEPAQRVDDPRPRPAARPTRGPTSARTPPSGTPSRRPATSASQTSSAMRAALQAKHLTSSLSTQRVG